MIPVVFPQDFRGTRFKIFRIIQIFRTMQYFVRAMENHKESDRVFGRELPCSGLDMAKAEAKRIVLTSDPAMKLQADACIRNGRQVRTKYRCWRNERGEFFESVLV